MFSINVILIPVFMANEKEAIHRQSWDSYSTLLGFVSTLIRDISWSAAGLRGACVAHNQHRWVILFCALF